MVWIGTSGYNYPEWKGNFYPSDLPAAKMLPYYAERFPTVELNTTGYRLPAEEQFSRWAEQTPPAFRFALECLRRVESLSRMSFQFSALRCKFRAIECAGLQHHQV